ncbi:MAG: hypothetical protein GY820_06065 [Gammaproteobacteria bacterium]|nr:hypothetical protein [Gammaproteobacteria bacterium]
MDEIQQYCFIDDWLRQKNGNSLGSHNIYDSFVCQRNVEFSAAKAKPKYNLHKILPF